MTLLQRSLERLITRCNQGQKAYAWAMAKQLAEIHPYELSELPEMLKSAMLSKSSKPSATDTKDATS